MIRSGHDPKAQVTVRFFGPLEQVDLETQHLLSSMSEVMSVRLREVIREELGGTYGVGTAFGRRRRSRRRRRCG